jgi:hypothetical protein
MSGGKPFLFRFIVDLVEPGCTKGSCEQQSRVSSEIPARFLPMGSASKLNVAHFTDIQVLVSTLTLRC